MLYRPRAAHHQRAPGQALVEFALCLPLLLLLILGLVAASEILMAADAVEYATRAAAHQAAITGGDVESTVAIATEQLDAGGLSTGRVSISVICQAPCKRYDPITVTIDYQGHVTKAISVFDTIHVSRSITIASEQDRIP